MSATANDVTTTEYATAPTPGEVLYARLTGPCDGRGGYPWAEVIDAPGGAWEPTGRTGGADDPAYELNGSLDLDGVGRVFELRWFARAAEWRFASQAGFWL